MGGGGKKCVSEDNDDNMAVVLSGGGAYGAYEVGVMKALLGGEMQGADYRPLNPQIFTGTSVGSFNASVMVAQDGLPPETAASNLEQIWLNDIAERAGGCGNGVYRFRGNPLRYFDPDCIADPLEPIVEFNNDTAFLTRSFLTRSLNFL